MVSIISNDSFELIHEIMTLNPSFAGFFFNPTVWMDDIFVTIKIEGLLVVPVQTINMSQTIFTTTGVEYGLITQKNCFVSKYIL